MTSMKMDAEMIQRLRGVKEAVQLCDDEGHVIGYFRPACGTQRYPEPPFLDQEEVRRRLASPDRRTIPEILDDLTGRT